LHRDILIAMAVSVHQGDTQNYVEKHNQKWKENIPLLTSINNYSTGCQYKA